MKNDLASSRLSYRKQVILNNQRPIKEEVFQLVTKSKLEGFDSKIYGEISGKEFAETVCRAVNNFEQLLNACNYANAVIAGLSWILTSEALEALKPVKIKLEAAIANAEK